MSLISSYLLVFLAAFVLAVVFTPLIRKLAWRWKILDIPNAERNRHDKPTPLLGGLAVFAAFFAVVFFLSYRTSLLLGGHLTLKHIWVVFGASVWLIIGGVLDDIYKLKPKQQIIWPLLAILTVIIGGVGIDKITNPFGGFIMLASWWSVLFTIVWLLIMIYTTKLLDGLDGLVSGIGTIGALIIFLLSTTTRYWQPETAFLAITLAGACLGFLIFNFNPASIFLGDSGPLFIGFILGILSIIAGSKIATALLVMGLPILDVVWVIGRRVLWEKKSPFHHADRQHLHFRLLDLGLSQRQTVLIFYFFAAAFGSLTLFLQSRQKLIALLVVVLVMIVLGSLAVVYQRGKK